jgi:hypothetical protein
MKIPFPEWLPDLPDFENPGCTVAKNVVPLGTSYGQFLGATVYSNALDARCQGAISTKDKDGVSLTFAGNATKLYKLSTAAYSNVSKVGGYTIGADEMWFFTRFNDFLIATNFNDAIQTFTLSSSSVFADLAASAPKARYVATVRNFLVVGNTFDGIDGNIPHRVRWSALDDPTSWTVSATTQSDYQDLDASNGWVKQVVSGDYGVIFQERAISRMDYVGSPVVWQFRPVEIGRGTLASGSVIKVGNLIFYLGLDGFYVFDGNQSISIGENKVNRTFFNEVDLSYLSRISSTVDFDKQIIYWAYPATGNTSGRPNKIIMYNYSSNARMRWSFAEIEAEFIFTSLSEGYTLDTLDTLSSSLDSLPFSLDSRAYTGDNYILSGFNSDHKHVNYVGTALTATLETAEFQGGEGLYSEVMRIKPIYNGTTATVTMQVGTRNAFNSSTSFASAISVNSSGECPVRANARYHRFRVNISGGFNSAQGVEVLEYRTAGKR